MQESSYTSPKIIFLVVHSLLRSWNQGQIWTQQPQKTSWYQLTFQQKIVIPRYMGVLDNHLSEFNKITAIGFVRADLV